MMKDETILRLSKVCKRFGNTQAVQDVDFELRRGEIHGLVGENGAGKTTLASIIYGTVRPDSGDIIIGGKAYKNLTPSLAKALGVGIVPQRLDLIPTLSVAENMFLNSWPLSAARLIDWHAINSQCRSLLQRVELDVDPGVRVKDLSYVDQQMIEIARILLTESAKIIILDEPTAPLSAHEIDLLYEFIGSLKDNGTSFIFISHYLDEVLDMCDAVTVLRNGQIVFTQSAEDLTIDKLVTGMIGDNVRLYPDRRPEIGNAVLEVRRLRREPILKSVSFSLHEGEILGIAGLKGSGRTELARSISGLDRFDGGEIILKGQRINARGVGGMLALGVGYLTEDRIKWGLVPNRSVRENLTIAFLNRLAKGGWLIDTRKEERIVESYLRKLKIKTPNMNQRVAYLSGGNQQKVILSRLLGCELDVILMDDPTFGIDINTKAAIYHLMDDLAKEGKAIVLISSDLTELVTMSDRIILLRGGEIGGQYLRQELDPVRLKELLEVKWNGD